MKNPNSIPLLQWAQIKRAILLVLSLVSHCSTEAQLDKLLFPGEAPERPVVVATTPVDGTIGVSPNSTVDILFSTAMDMQKTQDAFRLSSSTAQVEGSFTWEWNRLIFHPRSPLPGGKYTLSLGSAAESATGVDMGSDHVVLFYVGNDTEGPRFLSSSPTTGALDVDPSSVIRLSFSEAIAYASLADGLLVSPAFNYVISLENGGADVILTPSNPLQTGTTRITLNQRFTDTAGNTLQNESTVVFTVGSDFIAPGVLSVRSGTQTLTENILTAGIQKTSSVEIRFSEAMDRISVEDSISLSPSTSLHYNWISNEEVHISALPALLPETRYELRITSTARDTEGNPLERTVQYPFLTDHPDSVRPRLIEVRQLASTSASIPCTDNSSRAAPLSALEAMSLIDTSQWIDVNSAAGAKTCVLQFRFLFSNEMIRASLVDAFSTSVVLHPTGDLISLQVHDLQMDPVDKRVMFVYLSGVFPPKGIGETPIIRFTLRGGDSGARDINGNTMGEDAHLYVSY